MLFIVKTLSSFIDTDGSQIIVDEPVRNIDMGYIISPNAQIQVLPSQKVIRVIGNVYNPGSNSQKAPKSIILTTFTLYGLFNS